MGQRWGTPRGTTTTGEPKDDGPAHSTFPRGLWTSNVDNALLKPQNSGDTQKHQPTHSDTRPLWQTQGFPEPPGVRGGFRDPPTTDVWQTHSPTNVPPPRGGGGLLDTHPPTHPTTIGKMPYHRQHALTRASALTQNPPQWPTLRGEGGGGGGWKPPPPRV